jgi:hypothetical protein
VLDTADEDIPVVDEDIPVVDEDIPVVDEDIPVERPCGWGHPGHRIKHRATRIEYLVSSI